MGDKSKVLRSPNGRCSIHFSELSDIDLILDDGNPLDSIHHVFRPENSLTQIHRRQTSMGRILKKGLPKLGPNVRFCRLRNYHDMQ